jgi:Uma2 family endonuclease
MGWPPDDTEESVLGTNLHQATITNLRVGLNEVASALTPPGQAAPWQALSQTIVRNFRRRDGSRYKTLPDVFVYRQTIDENRKSLSVETDGPPVLIVEVLSDSTHENDLDLADGKGFSYARAGVSEYLILDPAGEFIAQRGQGWRLHDGAYRPWLPDEQGRWRSREIPAAIGMEGVRVTVYSADGRRQLREGEVAQELARRDAELAVLRQLVERLTGDEQGPHTS